MFKRLLARLQRGQAIIEYMPTIAGAMALASLVGIYLGGGVTQSYCKVVDMFGDTPSVCVDDSSTDEETPEEPEVPEEPVEAACAITLASADGEYPSGWNTSWSDGEVDTLHVNVSGLTEPVSWSLKLRFPTDPSSADTEVKSGVFSEDGIYPITLEYPAQGDWGPVAADGTGTYESHATLHISDPCDDVGWDRWYKAEWTADLEIGITHDVSPITVADEQLTYTVTVTNNGPNKAEIFESQGTVVTLPKPPGVTVVSATPSQGTCDLSIACDLGELNVYDSATVKVVTTVPDPAACALDGVSTVAAPRPPDPDTSNNTASTYPWCEPIPVCPDSLSTSFNLVNAATSEVIQANLQNGAEIVDPGVPFAVALIVDGAGSVELDGVTLNDAPYQSGSMSGPGSYSVDASVFADADAGTPLCAETGVSFTIAAPTPTCDATITGFSLVNTFTGDISPLTDGMTVQVDERDSFSVIANVTGSTVGSVGLDGGGTSRFDNDADYSLTPESGNSYEPLDVRSGTVTVTAQAFMDANGSGELCAADEVSFTMVEDTSPEFVTDPGCPASHPYSVLTFDHQPDPGNSPQNGTVALKNGTRRQSATLTMILNQPAEVALVATGSVGHPEQGCPLTGSTCNQTYQTNESWRAVFNGSTVATYLDSPLYQDVYLSHPTTYLELDAGSYDVYIRHNEENSGHSVGAFLLVCTDGPSAITAPVPLTRPNKMPNPNSDPAG